MQARRTQEEKLRRKVGGQELAPRAYKWIFSLIGNAQLSQKIKRLPSCCRLDEGKEVGRRELREKWGKDGGRERKQGGQEALITNR